MIVVFFLMFVLTPCRSSWFGRSSVCYNRVGCFNSGAPFFCLQRPINLLPESPDQVLTRYFLYTNDVANKKDGIGLDARHPDNFTAAWPNYKKRPTKIIVHGFLDNIFKKIWERDTKDELLKYGDYNVIIVDWHHGNRWPYTQATGNTRLVGAQIADLISTLHRKLHQSPSDFHIIGHSLGAHVAGYAGEIVPGLGRITGLDPAGPYFSNTDPRVRLDRSDANFVDVIHSNGESFVKAGLGTLEPLGHSDFYPNSGHNQPACDKSLYQQIWENGMIRGAKEYLKCEHLLSQKLFIESINSECPFTAFPCSSEGDYHAGKCHDCSTGKCGRMGFHATKRPTPTLYFLGTAKSSPYCALNYQLTITLSSSSATESGRLSIQLTGDKGVSPLVQLTQKSVKYHPGGKYSYNLPAHYLGRVTSLKPSWDHDSSIRNIWKWNPFGLRHPSLTFDSVSVKTLETGQSSNFCAGGAKVRSDKTVSIQRRC